MNQVNSGSYVILSTPNLRKLYTIYGDGSCPGVISDLSPTGFHVLRFSRAVNPDLMNTSWIICLKSGSKYITEYINTVPSGILDFTCDIYAFNNFARVLSEPYNSSLSFTKILRAPDVYDWN
jgi:hypothetical protein